MQEAIGFVVPLKFRSLFVYSKGVGEWSFLRPGEDKKKCQIQDWDNKI